MLRFASTGALRDRDFVLTLLAQNGHALQYASHTLKQDRAVVLKAVRQNGDALK